MGNRSPAPRWPCAKLLNPLLVPLRAIGSRTVPKRKFSIQEIRGANRYDLHMSIRAAANEEEQTDQIEQEIVPASPVEDSPEVAPAGTPRTDRRTRTERRVHPRYHFTTTAEILDLSSGAQCSARTSDISLGGCFIDTTSPFAAGTAVKLRLTQEKNVFVTEAVVTSSMAGMGMGAKFMNVAPQQMEVLGKWISQLSGDSTPSFSGFDETAEPYSDLRLQGEFSYTLNELIVALMRKGILSEQQGKEMLRRLHA